MKLRRRTRYKFRPYRQQPTDWRDWPGWHLVAVLIVVIVAALVLRACCG